MLQRLKINGQPTYVEFTPSVVEDLPNSRKWMLENGKIKFGFIEQPLGTFSKFTDVPDSVELDKEATEDLKERVFYLLQDYQEQQNQGIEPEIEPSAPTSSYPYDPRKIRIESVRWSLDYIYELIERGIVDLSPDFQRNSVWNQPLKSQLIESILLGIPIPAFYLARTNTGKARYQVVDGLQRLTAIKEFLQNEFDLRNLEYFKSPKEGEMLTDEYNLAGCYFKSDKYKRGIGEEYEFRLRGAQLDFNIIDENTPIRVKFDVFRRINKGGRPLNRQEMRNALMDQPTREFINKLAKGEAFIQATGHSVSDLRMSAQELVMRFIGFWYLRILTVKDLVYQGDMPDFLDTLVEKLNRDGDKYHTHIERDFTQAMLNAHYLFGEYAFRKCLPDDLGSGVRRQLLNKSLFTTWSVLLCPYTPAEVERRAAAGSFAHIVAEELKKSKESRPSQENGAANTSQENGVATPSSQGYYNVVSFKTNDKVILTEAFTIGERLVKENLNI